MHNRDVYAFILYADLAILQLKSKEQNSQLLSESRKLSYKYISETKRP